MPNSDTPKSASIILTHDMSLLQLAKTTVILAILRGIFGCQVTITMVTKDCEREKLIEQRVPALAGIFIFGPELRGCSKRFNWPERILRDDSYLEGSRIATALFGEDVQSDEVVRLRNSWKQICHFCRINGGLASHQTVFQDLINDLATKIDQAQQGTDRR